MELLIDTREKLLSQAVTKCCEKDIKVTITQLNLGDVHLLADDRVLAIVERKTISDLEASIRDGRYREQVSRLKQTCETMNLDRKSVVFLIEGSYLSHQPSRFGRGIPRHWFLQWFPSGIGKDSPLSTLNALTHLHFT